MLGSFGGFWQSRQYLVKPASSIQAVNCVNIPELFAGVA